jgi:hypothetical protein
MKTNNKRGAKELKVKILGVLGLFLMATVFQSRTVGGADNLVNLDFIKASYENQVTLRQNIIVEYKSYLSVGSFDTNLDDSSFKNSIYHVKDMKKGEKQYRLVSKTRNGETTFQEEMAFDGGITRVLGPIKKGTTSPKRDGTIHEGKFQILEKFAPEAGRVAVWDKPILTRLKEDKVNLSQQVMNGGVYYVVEGTCNESSEMTYRIWMDPKIDFMPAKIEEIGNSGTTVNSSRFLSYEKFSPGVWFPRRIESEGVRENKVINRNIYIVTSVVVNSGTFPADVFNIVFPPDTRIADLMVGASYIVPKN